MKATPRKSIALMAVASILSLFGKGSEPRKRPMRGRAALDDAPITDDADPAVVIPFQPSHAIAGHGLTSARILPFRGR